MSNCFKLISDTTFQVVTSRGCKTNPKVGEEFCQDYSEIGWTGVNYNNILRADFAKLFSTYSLAL